MARANGRDQQHSDRRSPAQSVLNDLPPVPAAHLPEPRLESSGAARLRLSGEVLVCVSLSAAECRLERFVVWQQQMLLYTHSNPFTNFLFFTPTQYGTFIHTHPSSAQPLTHHSSRESSPTGAAPPWSVRWGSPWVPATIRRRSRPQAPSLQMQKERNHRAVIPFRSASRCASVGSRLCPGPQSVCAGGYAGAAWSPPCQRQARVQAEEVWG